MGWGESLPICTEGEEQALCLRYVSFRATSWSLSHLMGSWRHSCCLTLNPPHPHRALCSDLPPSSTRPGSMLASNHMWLWGPPACHTPACKWAWPSFTTQLWLRTWWFKHRLTRYLLRLWEWLKTPVPAAITGLSRGQTAPAAGLHGAGFCPGHTWVSCTLQISADPRELLQGAKSSAKDALGLRKEVRRYSLESSRPGLNCPCY